MMQFDRMTLGKKARELGFVRDTFEKVCRLADVLDFIQKDALLSNALALKGCTAINLTIFNLPRYPNSVLKQTLSRFYVMIPGLMHSRHMNRLSLILKSY